MFKEKKQTTLLWLFNGEYYMTVLCSIKEADDSVVFNEKTASGIAVCSIKEAVDMVVCSMKKASGVVVYSMTIADGADCQTVLLRKKHTFHWAPRDL